MHLPSERHLWISLIFVSLILLAVLAWKAWPLLNPPIHLRALPAPPCDIQQQACSVSFSDGSRLTLDIQPRPLKVLEMLQLHVTLNGVIADKVYIDFRGVDMNMGYNRPTLRALGQGHFQGSGVLPVCTRARMTWEANVLLNTTQGLYSAPFRFSVENTPSGE
jgi:hypothetical protein